jgi:2,3-bisphosphoglycerate-independent phosphoglycerate mutase
MKSRDQRPIVLIVLDGWGINPRREGNAIQQAAKPCFDRLTKRYPATSISISGLDVGLPDGQMGNSEVGHMHLGAGRVVYQDITLIHRAIDDGGFFANETLLGAMRAARRRQGRLHLMGLLGDGGVHSHQRHLEALIELAQKEKCGPVYLHLFLDGRDTPPASAEGFVTALEKKIGNFRDTLVATISGRYFAMDRDRRWDRTEKVYRALTEGVGGEAKSALEAVRRSYESGATDEFVVPTVIEKAAPAGRVADGDAVVFFNFRADRARQLTRAFTQDAFDGFTRAVRPDLAAFVTMTEYDKGFELPVAFPPRDLRNILGKILSDRKIPQLRVAETEKYAHVTYFFNGGEEQKFPAEERILIPSDREVATYDRKPEMSAREITAALTVAMEKKRYGFALVNFANPDMVGHTGNFAATVRACEVVDACLGKIVTVAAKTRCRLLVTGDHGNAEQMIDYATGETHTAHTTNPVPFMVVDDALRSRRLRKGTAVDVAPTILGLLGIEPPPEMTGKTLFLD